MIKSFYVLIIVLLSNSCSNTDSADLENVQLRLLNTQISNTGGTYGSTQFYYDTQNHLIKKEVIGCSQNNNETYTLNQYEYDAQGRLIRETANAPYGIQTYSIDYFYINDVLSRIEKSETFSIGTSALYKYLFSSETTYTFEIQYFDTSGNPTYSKTYEGTILLDSLKRIVKVNNTQINGQDFRVYNFTYDNGNLVSASYQELGNTSSINISYDDKRNFHTYFSGTEFPGYAGSSCLRWDIMGMIWVEYFQYDEGFFDILPFFSNRNKNNPVSYNNGDYEFIYEYNGFDYPESIRFYPYIDDTEAILSLDYEIVE